jgi:hypothetical protein
MTDFKSELKEYTLHYESKLFEKMKEKCTEQAKLGYKETIFLFKDYPNLKNVQSEIVNKFIEIGLESGNVEIVESQKQYGIFVKWMD